LFLLFPVKHMARERRDNLNTSRRPLPVQPEQTPRESRVIPNRLSGCSAVHHTGEGYGLTSLDAALCRSARSARHESHHHLRTLRNFSRPVSRQGCLWARRIVDAAVGHRLAAPDRAHGFSGVRVPGDGQHHPGDVFGFGYVDAPQGGSHQAVNEGGHFSVGSLYAHASIDCERLPSY
jgi:hypothetical protein